VRVRRTAGGLLLGEAAVPKDAKTSRDHFSEQRVATNAIPETRALRTEV